MSSLGTAEPETHYGATRGIEAVVTTRSSGTVQPAPRCPDLPPVHPASNVRAPRGRREHRRRAARAPPADDGDDPPEPPAPQHGALVVSTREHASEAVELDPVRLAIA